MINSLSSDHKKIILNLYSKYKKKIEMIPIEKKGYHLQGGYILFIYNLLNRYNGIAKNYKKIDEESVLICILLSHIGYIDYFDNQEMFPVNSRGQLLGYKVLGINILADNIAKNNNENNRLFYEQCIMMNKDTEDKNIKFVNSLIELENIAS